VRRKLVDALILALLPIVIGLGLGVILAMLLER
jgi:hypothetical protein